MKLYRLYKTREEAQKDAPEGSKVVAYRDRFIIMAYVNFGISVGTLITYLASKL